MLERSGIPVFETIMTNVSLLLVYMLLGYTISKAKKVRVEHAKSFSGLLLYVLSPAMIINSFVQLSFNPSDAKRIGVVFLVTLLLQIMFMAILYAFLAKRYQDARFRILTVGSVLGNVGFFGMPVVYGLFPNEPIVRCYSTVNVMSMNLIVFTLGVFLITNDRKFISLRNALLNPTSISLFIAVPLYVLKVPFPDAALGALDLLARMVTPMCMIILGIRLSAVSLKAIFTRPFIYVTCAMKLLMFPTFVFLCVRWLPFLEPTMKTSIIVLAAAPAGAVIETLAELHECEQELSANVVLLTTMLSILTMPFITWLLL